MQVEAPSNIVQVAPYQYRKLPRARQLPSPQLTCEPENVDLNALQTIGVAIVGRTECTGFGKADFSACVADKLIAEQGLKARDANPPTATRVHPAHLSTPLEMGEVKTILWATGFKPDCSNVDLLVFNPRGEIVHEGSVCPLPGLNALGLPYLRRRRAQHISAIGRLDPICRKPCESCLSQGQSRRC